MTRAVTFLFTPLISSILLEGTTPRRPLLHWRSSIQASMPAFRELSCPTAGESLGVESIGPSICLHRRRVRRVPAPEVQTVPAKRAAIPEVLRAAILEALRTAIATVTVTMTETVATMWVMIQIHPVLLPTKIRIRVQALADPVQAQIRSSQQSLLKRSLRDPPRITLPCPFESRHRP